jgi:hypothetical protein
MKPEKTSRFLVQNSNFEIWKKKSKIKWFSGLSSSFAGLSVDFSDLSIGF